LTVLKNPHNPATTTFKPPQKPQQKRATITTTTTPHNREAARELANLRNKRRVLPAPKIKDQQKLLHTGRAREQKIHARARARKHKRGQKRAHKTHYDSLEREHSYSTFHGVFFLKKN
jgi:hypothetical protein